MTELLTALFIWVCLTGDLDPSKVTPPNFTLITAPEMKKLACEDPAKCKAPIANWDGVKLYVVNSEDLLTDKKAQSIIVHYIVHDIQLKMLEGNVNLFMLNNQLLEEQAKQFEELFLNQTTVMLK